MATDPLSLHNSSNARKLVSEGAPEGVLLAPAWKRCAAYILDVLVINFLAGIMSKGRLLMVAWNLGTLTSPLFWAVLLSWAVILSLHWLYFKYTGLWMGRSLGQRWFHIALVHHDATPLGNSHWGRRSFAKLRYAIPVIGQFWWGLRDLLRIRNHQQHRSSIDEKHNTAAAIDWSLPPATRALLR